MTVRADDLDPDTRARLFKLAGVPAPVAKPKKKVDKKADDRFAAQLVMYQLPPFERQFRFPQSLYPDNKRKRWKADYVNHKFMVMVEIDGGIWTRGAHGNPADITRNMMKQNDAAKLGYYTLRYATSWVMNKHAIADLQKFLHNKGWRPNHDST